MNESNWFKALALLLVLQMCLLVAIQHYTYQEGFDAGHAKGVQETELKYESILSVLGFKKEH